MPDNYDLYAHTRISQEALEHLRKLVPHYRKQRGYKVPMTAIASEAILAIQIPEEGKKTKQTGNTKQ